MGIELLAEDVHRLSTDNLAMSLGVLNALKEKAKCRRDRRMVAELTLRITTVEQELQSRQLSLLQRTGSS